MSPIAQAMARAGGNANAALLLYRLNYWQTYAKVRRRGFSWTVKSAEEWGEDTGLSARQVRRALATLRARGVVAEMTGRWGRGTRTFLRVVTAEAEASTSPNPATSETSPNPAKSYRNRDPLHREPFSKNYRKLAGELPAPEGSEGDSEEKASSEKSNARRGAGMKTRRNAKGGLTVKGVVGTWGSAAPSWDVVEAAALAADALPTAEKRRTAWAEVWRDAQLAAGAGQASTPKGTAKGQIAHLAEGLPPGSKRGVLIALLAYRWDEFREYLVAAAGWAESKLPVRPSAGLALTQIEHVVDWVAELEAASAAADVGGTSTSKSLDDFGA